ncbi:MAG: DUF4190 domain-containing protein [Candidatus Omnitrophica bacterium]|nr:DUF4190 domain-containing protein [Candidatus Omnitrophota bacterium]
MSPENTRTSRLAISSLICGLLYFIPIFNVVFAVLAIVFGISALRAISKYKDELNGKGLAIAGIILGAIGVILVTIGLTIALLFPETMRNIMER